MLLKKGSKGEDVKTLQKILGCRPDGVFGTTTEGLVKKWQAAHGLVADGIVGDKTWTLMTKTSKPQDNSVLGDGVIYNPISTHITHSDGRPIKYLVIHFTAGASSAGNAETKARNVFLNRSASADFTVDDDTMMQVNPNPLNYYCWAVGDGKGKFGVTNKNAISIEICSNLKSGTSPKVPNHSGWYFTKESIDNAVKLAKMIMKKYNIPLERVIRHYDASRKLCPGIIGWNPGTVYDPITAKPTKQKSTEEQWVAFKKRLI